MRDNQIQIKIDFKTLNFTDGTAAYDAAYYLANGPISGTIRDAIVLALTAHYGALGAALRGGDVQQRICDTNEMIALNHHNAIARTIREVKPQCSDSVETADNNLQKGRLTEASLELIDTSEAFEL